MTATQPVSTPRQWARDLWALAKPRVTLLVVFPALSGIHLAAGSISTLHAVLTLLGTVLVVGSANVLNCWLERDSDGLMTRTATRPLPAGRMEARVALAWGVLLLAVSLPMLAVVNPLPAILGLAAHVVYVGVYTPMKRKSHWSTFVGFAPGAMPALMGWTAVTGRVDLGGVLLFLVVFVWQMPHTLAIGLFRGSEYAAAGIKVVPVVAGERAAAWQILGTSLVLLPVTLAFYALGIAGLAYLVVAGALGTALVYLGILGVRQPVVQMAWARRVFFFSMSYLALLLAALSADRLG